MKILKCNFFMTLLVIAAAIDAHSQTVDEIIAKNIGALGGKDKIKSVTSIYLENSIEAMGNESPNTTIILNGMGAKIKSDINGQIMIQCFTDKGGWMINPFMGGSEATVMQSDQYKSGKRQIYVEESYMDYASKGNKVELLGKEKLQNDSVFKIKVTTSDSLSILYYFDATTYYVVQTIYTGEMMGQKMDVVNKLGDYKMTDYGFVLPNTITTSFGDQFSLITKLKKAEFNIPVDPTIFDKGNLK
jgi:hypothetical protein